MLIIHTIFGQSHIFKSWHPCNWCIPHFWTNSSIPSSDIPSGVWLQYATNLPILLSLSFRIVSGKNLQQKHGCASLSPSSTVISWSCNTLTLWANLTRINSIRVYGLPVDQLCWLQTEPQRNMKKKRLREVFVFQNLPVKLAYQMGSIGPISHEAPSQRVLNALGDIQLASKSWKKMAIEDSFSKAIWIKWKLCSWYNINNI